METALVAIVGIVSTGIVIGAVAIVAILYDRRFRSKASGLEIETGFREESETGNESSQ